MYWIHFVAALVALTGPTCLSSMSRSPSLNACNSTETGDFSEIHSPNYPRTYPNLQTVCWDINAQLGKFIKITFESFKLEFWHDYLKLNVGLPGKGFFIFFGNPVQVIGYTASSDNNRSIQALFHSDASKIATGFNLKISKVSATELQALVKTYSDAHLMSSPVFLTSQGGGKSQDVDLLATSLDNYNNYTRSWKEAIEVLGLSTPNGLEVADINSSALTFAWKGLGDVQPTTITVGNDTTEWKPQQEKTTVSNLTSGTTFNIRVTVKNKMGEIAEVYIQEKTSNAPCHGITCGSNALCEKGSCKCTPGYNGDPIVGCSAYCSKQTMHGLHFGAAYAGVTTNSDEKCENGRPISKASMVCEVLDGEAKYHKFVAIKSCNQTVGDIISKLTDNSTSDEILEQAQQLQLTTSNNGINISKEDVGYIANYCKNITRLSRTKEVVLDVLESNVNTINNLIQSNSIPPQQQDDSVEISETRSILTSINALANQVTIPKNEISREIFTKSMIVKVTSSTRKKDLEYNPVLLNGTSNVSINPAKIFVPVSVLDKVKDMENDAVTRVSFFVHITKNLFPSSNTANVATIAAVNIGRKEQRISGLRQRLEMTFPNDQRECGKPNANRTRSGKTDFNRSITRFYCVYWHESANEWRRDGGRLVINDPQYQEKCTYDHLTNFAVLMANQKLEPNIALETWSMVGLSLSIFGLVLTIIIHLIKEDVRKRRPTVILLHVCACLIISHVIFMIGIGKIENRVQCTVIAAFLQFFYLSSWTWMTIYAFDMYRSLVLVFRAAGSHYFAKITAIGYGVPLVITALDAGITVGYVDPRIKPNGVNETADGLYDTRGTCLPANSSYVKENVCWIDNLSLYIGFLTPVGLCIVFNIIVYVSVIKTIQQRRNTVKSTAKETKAKDYVFISITLIASTGIPWAVGYLMLLSYNQQFLTTVGWIFATLNTLQGLIIFLCTCVRNENMRDIWLQRLKELCCGRMRAKTLLSTSKSYELGAKNNTSQEVSNPGSTSGAQSTSLNAQNYKRV